MPLEPNRRPRRPRINLNWMNQTNNSDAEAPYVPPEMSELPEYSGIMTGDISPGSPQPQMNIAPQLRNLRGATRLDQYYDAMDFNLRHFETENPLIQRQMDARMYAVRDMNPAYVPPRNSFDSIASNLSTDGAPTAPRIAPNTAERTRLNLQRRRNMALNTPNLPRENSFDRIASDVSASGEQTPPNRLSRFFQRRR